MMKFHPVGPVEGMSREKWEDGLIRQEWFDGISHEELLDRVTNKDVFGLFKLLCGTSGVEVYEARKIEEFKRKAPVLTLEAALQHVFHLDAMPPPMKVRKASSLPSLD